MHKLNCQSQELKIEKQVKQVANALFLHHFLLQANTIQQENVYTPTVFLNHYFTNFITYNLVPLWN